MTYLVKAFSDVAAYRTEVVLYRETTCKLLKTLVGARGFEPRTYTVSTRGPAPRITRNPFLQRRN